MSHKVWDLVMDNGNKSPIGSRVLKFNMWSNRFHFLDCSGDKVLASFYLVEYLEDFPSTYIMLNA
jgi:hypothetical protein